MKIRSQDIPALVKRGPLPAAVLLYGQEQGLIAEAAALLRVTALGDDSEDAAFDAETMRGNEFDGERFANACRAMPFMASRRVILIKETENLSPAAQKIILAYLAAPSNTSLLVLMAGGLEAKSLVRKGFEADRTAWCAPFYPLEGGALRQWVQGILQAGGCDAEPDALLYLTARLEGDSLGARQELEKLLVFMGKPGRIRLEDALAVVGETAVYNSFTLAAEALTPGGGKRSLQILKRLLEAGEEPLSLLAAIAQRIRRLAKGRAMLAEGKSGQEINNTLRIFWKEQEEFLGACRRANLRQLAHMLLLCQECDAALKGGTDEPPIRAMEQFILRLATLLAPRR